MSRPRHYSPAIERSLVSVLYHEARNRNIPMTALVNQLLLAQLVGTPDWNHVHTASEAVTLNNQARASTHNPTKGEPCIDPTPSTQTK